MDTKQRTIDFRYAPQRCWTAICRPLDSHKTLVDEAGRLLYDFQRDALRFGNFRFGRLFAFALQGDGKVQQIAQRTESAAVPIVITELHYPKATLTLRTFAHQHDGDRRTDIVLWQIDANPNVNALLTGLWIEVQMAERRVTPATAAPSCYAYALQEAEAPRTRGLVDLFTIQEATLHQAALGAPTLISQPQPLHAASAFNFGPASGLTVAPALVTPEHPLSGALLFPLNHDQVDGLDEEWAHAALATERNFWQSYHVSSLPFTVPDEAIMAMAVAAARNIDQARERKDGLPEFQVGATVYRGFWVIDGYFFLEAAQFLGQSEEAMQGIDALLRRVKPNGAIEERTLDTKDTGLAMATMVRQCELQNDLSRLRALWPTLRRAVNYITDLHQAAFTLDKNDAAYGLLPPSFGNGGLGGIRAEYTTVLWLLVGLQATVRAAEWLALTDEATYCRQILDTLRYHFLEHAIRDQRFLPDGTPFLSMLKPGSGDHHWIHDFPGQPPPWQRVNPATGTWALAHAIYPGELFAADDLLVQNFCRLLDQLDDEEGIPAETGWLPYQALWTYAASFYAHVWLYAGRPDKAVDYLYAFANHAAPTRVWREEQSLQASGQGQLVGDMPHNWASVEFIRLVRNLLVFERGDRLELLAGFATEWLRRDTSTMIDTPTRFGPLQLSLKADAEGRCTLTINLQRFVNVHLATLVIHLPQAVGFVVNKVTLNGKPIVLTGKTKVTVTGHDLSA